jgi:hypothetical protein
MGRAGAPGIGSRAGQEAARRAAAAPPRPAHRDPDYVPKSMVVLDGKLVPKLPPADPVDNDIPW